MQPMLFFNQAWLKITSLPRVSVAVYGSMATWVWQYWPMRRLHFGCLCWVEFHAVSVFPQENLEAIGKIWGSHRTGAGIVRPVDPLRRGTCTARAVYARYPWAQPVSTGLKALSTLTQIARAVFSQTKLHWSPHILWAVWPKGFCW